MIKSEDSRIDILLNAYSIYYIKSKMTIDFYSSGLLLKVV